METMPQGAGGARDSGTGTGTGRGGGKGTDGDADARRVLEVVAGLLAEVGDGRGLGRVTLDASLEKDLGLGSLERVELKGRIEDALSVKLGSEAIAQAETPRALLEMAREARGSNDKRGTGNRERGTGNSTTPGLQSPAPSSQFPVPSSTSSDPIPRTPSSPPPEKARTLIEVLEYRAVRDRDRVHVLWIKEDGSEEPITYGELRRDAAAVAAGLRGLDLRPKAAVAIMLPTGRGYFAAFMGTLLAGNVPVPLYPPFRLDRIAEYIQREAKILANAGAEALVTFDRAARIGDIARDHVPCLRHVVPIERLLGRHGGGDAAAAAVTADDTALLQYTSGSTGDPKGVELTHANVLSNVRACAAGCGLEPQDVMVSWLPLYHDMGLIGGWLMNFYFGNPTVVLSPTQFLSRPETWLEAITRHRGTRSVAPNFAFDLCTKRIGEEALARIDLSGFRTVLNGSEPIVPATLERFLARFGPRGFKRTAFFPAYGLAENMVGVTMPPVDRGAVTDRVERASFEREGRAVAAAPESRDALQFIAVGRAVPGTEVRVVDADGGPLPERREGRIHFRGVSAFKGYFRNPEATARVKLADGWVDTGDLGYRAGDDLFITGRLKDIVIKGGRNYYPHEIEAAAGGVEGVRQGCCAAFGVRDEAAGTEQIVLVCETREGDGEAREELARAVREAVLRSVGVPPDRVVWAAPGSVPKTSSGKIQRSETRRRYLAGELGRRHGSFARQAAGLLLRGLPSRLWSAGRRAAEVAYGAYAAATILSVMGTYIATSLATPAGRPARRAAALGCKVALGLAGLGPRYLGAGRMPAGAAVLVTNHASYLDPFALNATLPVDTRYVVKGECRDVRYFGREAAHLGHVLVERHDAARSLEDLKELDALLRRGEKVLIFAEGTFFAEAGLRPFKLGAFKLAAERQVPVVPVVLRGTRRAFRDGMWLPRHVRIEVEVLDPIVPEGKALGEVIRLRDRAAAAIAARLDEPLLEMVDA